MRCPYCNFDACDDRIQGAFWTRKGFVVIDNIPGMLCQGCGEQFFAEETTQQIRKVLAYSPFKINRQILASVYSLSKSHFAKNNHAPQLLDRQYTACFESPSFQSSSATGPVSDIQGDPESLTCKYCESETVESRVQSVFWIAEKLVILENIPARVCKQCQEQYYDDEIFDGLAALEKGGSFPGTVKREISVPLFSFTDAVGENGGRNIINWEI
ncbi:MAG: YgiT-type zinc finger protein [Candidatus Omnitrophota bacterium]